MVQSEAATVDWHWYTPCVLMYAQHGLNSLFPEDALKGTCKTKQQPMCCVAVAVTIVVIDQLSCLTKY